MKHRQDFKHLWLLLYFPVYLLWFYQIEHTVTKYFHVIRTPIDSLIPFCEIFIIPYLLWFGYVAWGIAYFALKNKQDYYRLCAFLFTGMTVFLIVSTVYPNGHYLRPSHFTRNNIFTMLCQFVYAHDTPTNLFPSIHVYNSIGVHLAVCKSEAFQNKKWAKRISFVLATSIILSTMFVKQHSAFDVFTAFLLALVMYKPVYQTDWSRILASKQRTHDKKSLPQL
jgi:membrane-associated phospholipid phosphatase